MESNKSKMEFYRYAGVLSILKYDWNLDIKLEDWNQMMNPIRMQKKQKRGYMRKKNWMCS